MPPVSSPSRSPSSSLHPRPSTRALRPPGRWCSPAPNPRSSLSSVLDRRKKKAPAKSCNN
jgi:hypothetical protein